MLGVDFQYLSDTKKDLHIRVGLLALKSLRRTKYDSGDSIRPKSLGGLHKESE